MNSQDAESHPSMTDDVYNEEDNYVAILTIY